MSSLIPALAMAAWCAFLARLCRLEGVFLLGFIGFSIIAIGWTWALSEMVDDLLLHGGRR